MQGLHSRIKALLGSPWRLLFAMLALASSSFPIRAEGYLTTGIPYAVEGDQLTLVTKVGPTLVPLPNNLDVFVSQRIAISDARPGDTIAAAGVKVKELGTPTLEAGETFIVNQPVPDAARKALARRFLTPQPKSDPFNIGFATWSGIVSRAVDGGVEFKRDDGTLVVARPNSDNRVGRLRPGTRADLAAGRLSLFGVSEKVTAIIVTVPRPSAARTLVLAPSQVVSGVPFPAGTTLHMSEDGSVDRGVVPVPTAIAGLLLVGEFEIGLQGVTGTLAEPAEIDGVPCAADEVYRDKDWGHEWPAHVECILARGTAINDHDVAEGTKVAVSSKPSGERQLYIGTLAHAELLFDVTWPAGTVLHATAASPQRLAHAPASPGEDVSFCTPEGQDVSVPGVVLHGKVGYDVRENGRALESCDEKDRPDDHDGYAAAGAEQHTRGSQANTGSPWKWDDYRTYP